MSGTWASVVAVLGTLLGVLASALTQRWNSIRSERLARERQLWEEQLTACGSFAGALVNYRRAEYDRAHRNLDEPDSAAHRDAREESYQVRATAQQELFRVQLLTDNTELLQLAEQAFIATEEIHEADTKEQVKRSGDQAKQVLGLFIEEAGCLLRRRS
ncbi:hypothetical protein [Actinomadura bangladeshensis]|uniref:Uncharacterized protein n=1 Tax=Actinomadura bangladeshensis TaxID=453573 RepID=A0A6L9QRA6_9ACTN|nr:hypothetical protein [Actinomadura bangladeshensis]NEA27646.1 hypothetical protein [Actinomadura bangladeshensis]